MPRDGALTLSDVLSPTLSIVCEPCNRHGRYSVARLVEEHGDAKLTELIVSLVNCPKARSASVYDRCRAVYEGLASHRSTLLPYLAQCSQSQFPPKPSRRSRRRSPMDMSGGPPGRQGRLSGPLCEAPTARHVRQVADQRRLPANKLRNCESDLTRAGPETSSACDFTISGPSNATGGRADLRHSPQGSEPSPYDQLNPMKEFTHLFDALRRLADYFMSVRKHLVAPRYCVPVRL